MSATVAVVKIIIIHYMCSIFSSPWTVHVYIYNACQVFGLESWHVVNTDMRRSDPSEEFV